MEKNEENIIKFPGHTIVINGGTPLEGCPKDWDEAKAIIEKMNEGKEEDEPQWEFDCGFKLDYDGSLIKVCGRFYPPKTHYGSTWDGFVIIYFKDREIGRKKFDYPTLEELQYHVEQYAQKISDKVEIAVRDIDFNEED